MRELLKKSELESLSSEMIEERQRAEESEIEMKSPMEKARKADETETNKDCDLMDQDFIRENSEFPFDDTLFQEPGREQTNQNRAEKRKEHRRRTGFSATREQLIEEQQKDLDIQTWKAREDTEAVDIKNGVLCRLWKPKNKLGKADIQIVLAEMYRRDILKMARYANGWSHGS